MLYFLVLEFGFLLGIITAGFIFTDWYQGKVYKLEAWNQSRINTKKLKIMEKNRTKMCYADRARWYNEKR